MHALKFIEKKLVSRLSWKFLAGTFLIFIAILAFAPSKLGITRAESCASVYNNPVFNPYPVTFQDPPEDCKDFPLIEGRLTNGTYPRNQQELQAGVTAQGNNEVQVLVYFHNGASENLDPNHTTIRNFKISTNIDTVSGSAHTVGTTLSGDNAVSLSGNMVINTPANSRLEIVPGSGVLYDYRSQPVQTGITLSPGVSVLNMQDFRACFQFSGFFRFTVRVVQAETINNSTCVSVTPVAVLAPGQSFSTSVTVQNTGNGPWNNTFTLRPQNPSNFGFNNQYFLSGGTTVAPGAQTSFNLSGAAPNVPGSYTTGFQMSANGVLFGAICPLAINVQTSNTVLAISKTVTPTSVQAGQTVGYTIRVSNTSANITATNVVLTDDFANGGLNNIVSVNASNGASGSGFPSGSLFLGNLTPGQEVIITYSATVNRSSGQIINTARAQASNASQVQASATVTVLPQLVNNASCVSIPNFGPLSPSQAFSTTVVVSNTGSTTWTNNYRLVSQSSAWNTPASFAITNSVAPNNQASFTISGNAPATAGSYVFAWQMSQDGVGSFGAVCSVTVTVNPVVINNPLLSIEKSASPSTVKQGDIVNYTIRVRNTGLGTANSVSVSDDLGLGGLGNVSNVTVSNGASTVGFPGNLSLGNLSTGQTVTITYSAAVVRNTGIISNTARAFALNHGQVQAVAIVAVNVTLPPPVVNNSTCINILPFNQITQGQPFSLPITFQNTGTTHWDNNFRLVGASSTTSGNSYNLPGGTVSPGGQITFTVNPTVPNNPGTYYLGWQMTNGFSTFGAICATTLVIGNNNQVVNNVNSNNTYNNNIINQNGNGNSANVNQSGATVTTGNGNNTSQNQQNNSNTQANNNSGSQTAAQCGSGFGSNAQCSLNTTNPYIYTAANNGFLPKTDFGRLTISKLVRNVNQGGNLQKNVSANSGDRVAFDITVRNTGSDRVNNVHMSDTWNGGMTLDPNTIRVDSSYNSFNNYNTAYANFDVSLGSLDVGQQRRITFEAIVNGQQASTIQNIARATGDNVPAVQDDAFVYLSGNVLGTSNPFNLSYSKKAWNDTKNIEATSVRADKEDFITYTLTVRNNGSVVNNFVIADDISGVIPYADVIDNGGGVLSGNTITFPGVTVPANGSVSKSFRVRVKFFLADNLSYTMTNTYGNTLNINIGTGQVQGAFVAPKTGGDATSAAVFGGLITSAFALFIKRKSILNWLLV